MIDPKLSPLYLIRQLQLKTRFMLGERLSKHKVSPVHYRVMSFVNHPPWSTADLARSFQITPQSMNHIVSDMRKKKLITRRVSAGHRRILHIRLTASGKRLLEKCEIEVAQIEKDIFKDLSKSEVALFKKLLNRAAVAQSLPDRSKTPKRERLPSKK